jgi:hypothetical protein
MPKDPRTLKEIVETAECHLVPDWSGASGKTVPLEKKIDNDIGTYCDGELEKYLNNLTGTVLPGKVAMAGGSKTVGAEYDLLADEFEVAPPGHKKMKAPNKGYEEHALGVKGGEATVESFTGTGADGHYACVSIIHSAFLVLHALGRPEVFEPMFDEYRALFDSASKKQLTEEQRTLAQATVLDLNYAQNPHKAPSTAAPLIDVKADGDPAEPLLTAVRNDYDPNFDPGDGLLANFPNQSVEDTADAIVVKVPYSKSLRAVVKFPKKP